MDNVVAANRALDALRKVESEGCDPASALEIITGLLSECLDRLNAVKNSQNAGQIAHIWAALLFPDDPLSDFIFGCLESGSMPDFSEAPPHPHSVYRACAIFAGLVGSSWSKDAPHASAKAVDDLIERLGYLPPEVREY